jgi:VWFA-related protein
MKANPTLPFALVMGAAAATGWTQNPPPKAAPVRAFGVEVQVIALPVFVTDKNGKAVPGLTAADFEVQDAGKRTEVVAFQAVDAGAAPGPLEHDGARAIVAAARRQFLFLFDLGFSTPRGFHQAREAALAFLASGLGPSDLVSVATLGPGGPDVLVGFTSDRAQASEAVARLGMVKGERLKDPLGLAWDLGIPARQSAAGVQVLDDPAGARAMAPAGLDPDYLRDMFYLRQRNDQTAYARLVGNHVSGLDALAKLLDSVQGRKQVILFSAGYDQSVVGGVEGAERQASNEAVVEGRLWEVTSEGHFGDASARFGLGQLFRDLAVADVVIHAVDVGGLEAGSGADDATRAPIGRGRDSLAQLATGSGGLFLKEVNDVTAALGQVAAASRYFYVLGISPSDEAKPGRPRKLAVKVKRPGAKATTRAAYSVKPAAAPAPVAEARVSMGDAIAKGLSGGDFALYALVVPTRAADGTVRLPVALEIDGAELIAGVADGKLPLEVYGYVLDAEGRIVDAIGASPTLDLARSRGLLEGNRLQFLAVFKAPQGEADLRFLVRHPASGRAASLRVMAPEDRRAGAWPLSAPLVMADPASRLVVSLISRGRAPLDLPFRVGDRAFSPQAGPTLRNDSATEICLLAGLARLGSLETTIELQGADGKALPLPTSGPMRIVNDPDGVFRIVIPLTPSGVPAGSYLLRVTLRSTEGLEATSEQRVAVE